MDNAKRIEEILNDAKKGMEKRIADYTKKETTRYEECRKSILKYANEPLQSLDLNHRSYRILNEMGIKTMGELICLTEEELYNIKSGFGKKSLNEVITCLDKVGLRLRNRWND